MNKATTTSQRSTSVTLHSSARQSLSLRGVGAPASQRRRSSTSAVAASVVSLDDGATLDRVSLFCPMPKRGLFYVRAYREHKEKRRNNKKHAASNDDASSVDDDIPLKRDLSRRKRNSFLRGKSEVLRKPTNSIAFLAARVEAEKPVVTDVYNHNTALLAGLSKSHMLDVSLVGFDGVPVRASRFVLACYSPVLEDLFFKEKSCELFSYNKKQQQLSINCCCSNALRAAVYHCFSGKFPHDFDVETPDESVARTLAQTDYLAHVLKLKVIEEQIYRSGRKLINRRPVLACAFFDELSCRDGTIESIKRYALDTMREMPMETLLGGGVQWLRESSIEAIMQDQDLDVDEFYMFKILKAWESGATRVHSDRFLIAQRLSKYIELKYIETDLLKTQVKDAGYFDSSKISETVALIEESLANRDSGELERVLVEGAGTNIVNGIYVRVVDEVGLSEEEILFVKEADDGYSDVGLYLWGAKWHIAMCSDYSSCFYSCPDNVGSTGGELVPQKGWSIFHNGQEPPPSCTYLPHTRASRQEEAYGQILAPNLEEMIDPTIAEKRRSCYFTKRNDDTVEKRNMTLEQMMNLPEDRSNVYA